jgi:hypothetical protein
MYEFCYQKVKHHVSLHARNQLEHKKKNNFNKNANFAAI